MHNYLLSILLIVSSTICYSQSNTKWGNYSKEELSMSFCSFEKDAGAVVLYEKGLLDHNYGVYTYKVHRRIKIFDESEINRGVIIINYNPETEKVSNVEGITTSYPLGKKRSVKLRSDQIEEKEISLVEAQVIVRMPTVRKGSIIEYRYEKKIKEFDKPEDWYFQHDIPTLYSVYEQTNIPADVNFFTSLQGKMMLSKYRDVGQLKYELTDIPSISGNVDFIYSPSDFVEKIEFRTSGNSISNSWNILKDNYLRNRSVDKILGKGPAMVKLEIESMNIHQDISTYKQAIEIYRQIQKKYQWSGEFSVYPDGKMNSADINLQLYRLLKQINLRTYPVLLSTLANGTVYKKFPKGQPFDHVIVKMAFNNRVFFLDATNNMLPFGYLPPYSEQRDGFQIGEEYEWIMTEGYPKGKETTFQQITYDEGSLIKKYDTKWDMITSARLREQDEEARGAYVRKTFSIPETRQLYDYEMMQVDELDSRLTTQFTDKIDRFITGQNRVYLNPIPYTKLLINPFEKEERFYPIQYETLPQIQFTSIIDIPEGYEASKLPEPSNIALPEEYGRFLYQAVQQNGKINFTMKFEILKNNIPSRLYPAVRNFYETVTEKCEEPIVFDKKQ